MRVGDTVVVTHCPNPNKNCSCRDCSLSCTAKKIKQLSPEGFPIGTLIATDGKGRSSSFCFIVRYQDGYEDDWPEGVLKVVSTLSDLIPQLNTEVL